MYCTKCGVELREDDCYCSRCGNRTALAMTPEMPRPLMLDKRNKKIAVFAPASRATLGSMLSSCASSGLVSRWAPESGSLSISRHGSSYPAIAVISRTIGMLARLK